MSRSDRDTEVIAWLLRSRTSAVNKQVNDSIGKDFQRAFVTSLPITFVILLIVFGALVAASVPILLALTASWRRSAWSL
jgi:uncharacterized membrane protein YdfJ with MMPL/SSD domain